MLQFEKDYSFEVNGQNFSRFPYFKMKKRDMHKKEQWGIVILLVVMNILCDLEVNTPLHICLLYPSHR